MPIHHAVLALLNDQPSYGYELKAEFEAAVGPQWGELNIGHLYQVLDRLIRDGLAIRRSVSQTDRPDKVVYRISAAGRRELEQWLSSPHVRTGGYRDDFFLKIVAASRIGRESFEQLIRTQRAQYLGELAALTELRAGVAGTGITELLIDAARLSTEASLRITELAEERMSQLIDSSATSNRAQRALGTQTRIDRAADTAA
jgi:DNA-binding PadR family transcriptional regulator